MGKVDLNKNSTPYKHGNMDNASTRLDVEIITQLDEIAKELGMKRSTFLRYIIYDFIKKYDNDGSFHQQISQRRKSAEQLSANREVMRILRSLNETKTALNRIGNLLNQDVRIRNTYIKHLDENGMDEVKRAYEDEKNKIQKKYNHLMGEQEKLRNGTRDHSEREKYTNNISELKEKRDREILLLDARYSDVTLKSKMRKT